MEGFFYQILSGTVVTLELALVSLFLGLLIGLVGAIAATSSIKFIRYSTNIFLFIVRGLPELLVLFFIYFGFTQLLSYSLNRYVDVSPFIAGVLTLGLISGAYAVQVFRGALLAIHPGQITAAEALGFTAKQIFIRIKIPHAWRHALPGLGNIWLVLLKDTAIVSLIGLAEIMNQAKIAASATHEPFNYYLIAACIYLVITSISNYFLNILTFKANRIYLHD